MKYIIACLTIFCGLSASAQHASIDKDTVFYNGKKYCVGDTVHLGYGSAGDKDFAFVQMGGALMGLHKLDRRFSKADVILTKALTRGGKIFLRGKATEGMPPGYNVFIDVEGAVDNKELRD